MDRTGQERPGTSPEPSGTVFPAPESAEQVYQDYGDRVYNTARRMLRSDLDAEEVTQEVLLQVVRKLPSFRGESAFPTWLHRVTVNAALLHRRRARRPEQNMDESFDQLPGDSAIGASARRWLRGPAAQLIERETRTLLERAIAGLPDGYREVLIGADVDGLPNQVMADAMGLSLAALKSRLHRSRLMLRDALAPYFAVPAREPA